MPKEKKLAQRLVRMADLQDEPIPGLPLIELAGDRRVLIEHHNGVAQYSTEEICVKVKFGYIVICGSSLELSFMTRGQLIISGCIDCVKLFRGRK